MDNETNESIRSSVELVNISARVYIEKKNNYEESRTFMGSLISQARLTGTVK